jgi:hypothetical protein
MLWGLRSSIGFAKPQEIQASRRSGSCTYFDRPRLGDSILTPTSLLDQAEATKLSSIEPSILFQASLSASNHAWRS